MAAIATYLLVPIVVYALIVAYLYVEQRRLIYRPEPGVPDPAMSSVPGLTIVETETADGIELRHWYWEPPRAGAPVIIYFQGNSGNFVNRLERVAIFTEARFGVMLVGYRGFSGNPGRPDEVGLYADASSALDFLRNRGIRPESIVLYGESLGTGVATEMAARGRGAALILDAPFTSLPEAAGYHYPWVPVRYLVKDAFETLRKISGISIPVFVMHGDEDSIVPVRFGRSVLAAAREPKEGFFVPGARHSDLYDFGAAERVLGFLEKHGLGAGKQ